MRKEPNSEAHNAAEITPSVPWRLSKVTAGDNYTIQVEFNDGTTGTVEMEALINSENAGVFATLKDKDIFSQVHLEYGVATWPGGVDLAPDAMHTAIKATGTWILK